MRENYNIDGYPGQASRIWKAGRDKRTAGDMLTVLGRVLDQNRVTELIDFVLVFALLLALVMLILFLLILSRSRRLQREMRESSSELYYFLLPTLALDGEDHQLIKRLSEFLPFPQQKHRIMVNPRIFDFCARRLIAARPGEQKAVRSLRDKLGFPKNAEVLLPVSTRDLPLDMTVVVVQKGNPPVRARVIAKDEASLSVELQGQASEVPAAGQAAVAAAGAAAAPATGPAAVTPSSPAAAPSAGPAAVPSAGPAAAPAAIPISVYFQNRAGFFSFSTRITAREDQVLRLDHSDAIRRYQRRRYARKQLRLPVFIHPYEGSSAPLKSVLVELSGGGASLQNPNRAFKADQQVELSFAPHGEKFHVLGRIVRVSKGGQVVHVEFQALEETERKRISHSVF
jgi:hypothetical protein